MVARGAVEATDDGDGGVAQLHDACRRCRNTGLFRQFQRQYLTTGDAAAIAHTGELANGQPAVFVDHRALGAHATQ